MNKKVAIIGCEGFGTLLAQALVDSGFTKPQHIILTKRNMASLKILEKKGVLVATDNNEAVRFADFIILDVKPIDVNDVLKGLRDELKNKKHVLCSLVTGITFKQLQKIIVKKIPMARVIINPAVSLQESMNCICFKQINDEQRKYVEDLFNQLGRIIILNEKLMNAATILSSCGTAYAMRYLSAHIKAGIEMGLSNDMASLITAQTVKGAAELVLKNNSHPEQEINKITVTKKSITTGLKEMESQGFSLSLIRGITASYEKIGVE
ncbi:MAG TPA: pyrroline-5-carboxylate reductase dimerization domain-containing protein [Chitinophagaceae bacterium]|nr:pyrroline-5-carboxylate reductase dimerization domain-containing protein [Chitinophagaceae bacterium]